MRAADTITVPARAVTRGPKKVHIHFDKGHLVHVTSSYFPGLALGEAPPHRNDEVEGDVWSAAESDDHIASDADAGGAMSGVVGLAVVRKGLLQLHDPPACDRMGQVRDG